MLETGQHLFIGFKGTTIEEELKFLIRDYRPGGIVLFKRNIEGRAQLKSLVSSAQTFALEEIKRPLYFAIDQEGGIVQRLAPHFNSIPSARSLSEQGREAVSKWAAVCAADLNEIGVQINFAPVLDMVEEGSEHLRMAPVHLDPLPKRYRPWETRTSKLSRQMAYLPRPSIFRGSVWPNWTLIILPRKSPTKVLKISRSICSLFSRP